MQIKNIHTTEKDYAGFIRNRASVYNTPEWLSLYGNKCKIYGIYKDEKLVGVFNTYTFKKTILEFFIPPPFMPDCALVISNDADQQEIADSITSWIAEKITKKNYSLFQFNISYKFAELFEKIKTEAFSQKWKYTYVLDISITEDVQSLYAAKRRQQIRRAIKDGLSTEPITDMNVVFEFVKKTFNRQGKTIDEGFIKKILFDYATKNNSFAFASIINGKPCVVYFCIHHNKEAFYLMGGYDETIKHIGAGPLAMNACIEYAKKIGMDTYDFEGSMEPSIEKYFKQFGGTKKLYPSFERSSKLGEIAVKIKKLIKG